MKRSGYIAILLILCIVLSSCELINDVFRRELDEASRDKVFAYTYRQLMSAGALSLSADGGSLYLRNAGTADEIWDISGEEPFVFVRGYVYSRTDGSVSEASEARTDKCGIPYFSDSSFTDISFASVVSFLFNNHDTCVVYRQATGYSLEMTYSLGAGSFLEENFGATGTQAYSLRVRIDTNGEFIPYEITFNDSEYKISYEVPHIVLPEDCELFSYFTPASDEVMMSLDIAASDCCFGLSCHVSGPDTNVSLVRMVSYSDGVYLMRESFLDGDGELTEKRYYYTAFSRAYSNGEGYVYDFNYGPEVRDGELGLMLEDMLFLNKAKPSSYSAQKNTLSLGFTDAEKLNLTKAVLDLTASAYFTPTTLEYIITTDSERKLEKSLLTFSDGKTTVSVGVESNDRDTVYIIPEEKYLK